MVKAEQIPDEVVEAAVAMRDRGGSMSDIIRTAINAWPGFEYRADAAFPAFGYGPAAIILPLPHEASE